VTDFIDPELTANGVSATGAQIGVLTLAAILRERGLIPQIVNLDDHFLAYNKGGRLLPVVDGRGEAISAPGRNGGVVAAPQPSSPVSFFAYIIEHLKPLSFDVFGFSSICGSYPLTLRLARDVRRSNPDAWIILGGPQASVVDVATMREFPCVDLVVRGEADVTFPTLLDFLSSPDPSGLEGLPGITFRRGDEVIRNPNAPVVQDLDCLPLPAFDLDAKIGERDGIHLEIGRGCPFTCTFCSTNDFFRRNFRLKSTQKTIQEMQYLHQQYGFEYFSFVHDMYTVDRKKVVEFCQALLELGEHFTWGCSARTDCVDDELIALMAAAGCQGIFFGIETGSKRMQQVIHKKLDLAEAWRRIQCADRHRVEMAVALIIGFPEETRDDLRDTIHFFIESLRYDYAKPQISLLAPLAATPIYDRYKGQLVFDRIFSSMSHQGWQQDAEDLALIEGYPEVFPDFYAIPLTWLDRSYLKELVDFIIYLAEWFRWLPVALLQDSGDFLAVFDRWRKWSSERIASEGGVGAGRMPFYAHQSFPKEFLQFVQTCYLEEMATARVAIQTLLRAGDFPPEAAHDESSQSIEETDRWEEDCVPYLRKSLRVLELEVDYKELIESLRNNWDLSRVSRHVTTVVYRPAGKRVLKVWQLPPLSATLLRLCDGRRTIRDLVREFSLLETDVVGIPAEQVVLFGLMQLRDEGYIGLSIGPVPVEEPSLADGTTAEQAFHLATLQTAGTQQPWPPRRANEGLMQVV